MSSKYEEIPTIILTSQSDQPRNKLTLSPFNIISVILSIPLAALSSALLATADYQSTDRLCRFRLYDAVAADVAFNGPVWVLSIVAPYRVLTVLSSLALAIWSEAAGVAAIVDANCTNVYEEEKTDAEEHWTDKNYPTLALAAVVYGMAYAVVAIWSYCFGLRKANCH